MSEDDLIREIGLMLMEIDRDFEQPFTYAKDVIAKVRLHDREHRLREFLQSEPIGPYEARAYSNEPQEAEIIVHDGISAKRISS